jgi:hypothetical protein
LICLDKQGREKIRINTHVLGNIIGYKNRANWVKILHLNPFRFIF